MLIVHLDGVQPLDKTWGSKLLLKHETCYQYKCSGTEGGTRFTHSDLNEIPEGEVLEPERNILITAPDLLKLV